MDIKKKRKKWGWIVLGVVALLLIGGALQAIRRAGEAGKVTYASHTVSKGDITSTVTGSGKLESLDEEEISIPGGIEALRVLARPGDAVSAGDVLALLDGASLSSRAAALLEELSALDAALARLEDDKRVEAIYAPVSGRIKYLPVAKGSDVLEGIRTFGALAFLSTDGLMEVEIQTKAELTLPLSVTVKWPEGQDTGKVAARTAEGYLVTLDDDQIPYGAKAQVYSGETLLGEGTADIHAPAGVYAAGGTVSKIHYSVGDKVTSSSKLFTLKDGPFTSAYQQKYAERQETAARLEEVLRYKSDPRILSPAAGVVGEVNLTEGSAAGEPAGESTAFVIHTRGAVKMEVLVDELDIHALALGQSAAVTLDAVASEKFQGVVSRISNLGDSAKNIATFSVELTLSPDERFFEGMNGSATILVKEAKGVLKIPVETIAEDSEGAFVYLGSDLVKTYIKTGLSDGEYAEVKEGLAEGDVIQYAVIAPDSFSGFGGSFSNSRFSGGRAPDGE